MYISYICSVYNICQYFFKTNVCVYIYIFKYGPQMTYGWFCWFCWCNSCDLFPFPIHRTGGACFDAPRITWILTSMSSESVDLNTMVCEPEKISFGFSIPPLRSSSKLSNFISQKLETPWNFSLGGENWKHNWVSLSHWVPFSGNQVHSNAAAHPLGSFGSNPTIWSLLWVEDDGLWSRCLNVLCVFFSKTAAAC